MSNLSFVKLPENTMGAVLEKTLEKFGLTELENQQMYSISDLNLWTDGPEGKVKIRDFIQKRLPAAVVIFENGSVLVCAQSHLLNTSEGSFQVKDLRASDTVTTSEGTTTIKQIILSDEELNFYDIGVDSESNLFYTADEICHHNTGKALPDDSEVLTGTGWVRIADLTAGSMVLNHRGVPTEVTGVYPQGLRPTMIVVFDDGTVIECDESHLWEVTALKAAPPLRAQIQSQTEPQLWELVWETPSVIETQVLALLSYNSELKLAVLRYNPETQNLSYARIVRIERTGVTKSCTCIKIADPRGLFITTGYICTHNTQNVEDTLAGLGLRDGQGYFKVTGTSSAVGLYELLYRNKDKMLLFDDADGVVADQDARNILKAATDTKKVRKIVWNKASKRMIDPDSVEDNYFEENDDYLPKWFEFTGKVIFISNLSIDKLDPDGALRTRALMISIDPTDAELYDFMGKIVDKIQLEEGNTLGHDDRLKVLEVVKSGTARKDVSLRKLVRALNICAAMSDEPDSWPRLIKLYA